MNLCLGTVQFGMDYGVQGNPRPSASEINAIFDHALANGICRFDTASAYGTAETVIGDYLKLHPDRIRQMRIISKLSPKALESQKKEAWPDIMLEHARRSLENMHISRLEAYLFHNAEHIFDHTAVKALDQVRVRGLAKRIGVSIYSPAEAMKALEYDEIKAIQIPYNVFDQRLDRCGFFSLAKEKGVQIYARSSLLQGLVMMDPRTLPENMQFASGYLERFLSVCRKYRISPLKAAIGYAGAHPDIDCIVFGVDNLKQLSEYTAMRSEHIPDEMVADLRTAFSDVEEKLVNPVLWNQ